MNGKKRCEEFNELLADFVLGRLSADEEEEMRKHLLSCRECREIHEIKKALVFSVADVEDCVPDDAVDSLASSVINRARTAREHKLSSRPRGSRFLVPAMAAAVVVFVFVSGFMLNEIRHLGGENDALRSEIAAMEIVIGGSRSGTEAGGALPALLTGGLGRSAGAATGGEARRMLEALPNGTRILSEEEAERLISGSRLLRRYADHIDDRPWEGGLTSNELLDLIEQLDLDPGTRIHGVWRSAEDEI
jgi:hypothetical protein